MRDAYSGDLVYASNYGEEVSIVWWDTLDYIGVNAYDALTSSNDPTLDDLKAAWGTEGKVDLHEQALCYRATLESLWSQPWLAGIYWWSWDTDPEQGGEQDTGYTPHGKPAEEILQAYYGSKATYLPLVGKGP